MPATLEPYLNFDGKTAEAMRFYQSIFGGELQMQSFADFGAPAPDETKDQIMHASLKSGSVAFMASDGGAEHQVHMGDNISLSISGEDREQLVRYFDGLAEGGRVDMPLAKQSWGDEFGMLTDRFGVHWMVNISASPAG